MAEIVNNEENVRKLRIIRSSLQRFVSKLCDRIISEINCHAPSMIAQVEMILKFVAHNMTELKNLDDKIAIMASSNELDDDISTSVNFYVEMMDKLMKAVVGKEDEKILLEKLERLYPCFQKPAWPDYTMAECVQPPLVAADARETDNQLEGPNAFPRRFAEMPRFDGNLVNWITFWNHFERDVHNETAMPIMVKFHILKELLIGDQFKFIKEMYNIKTNYEIAVAFLRSKYGIVYEIASLYKQKLLDMNPVNEDGKILRKFYSGVEYGIAIMKSLGAEIDQSSLVASLLSKLPAELKERFDLNQQTENGDLIASFLKFLWIESSSDV